MLSGDAPTFRNVGPALADLSSWNPSSLAALLAVSATGIISSAAAGADFNYTIALTNTSTTGIGTFWFAWTPGHDYLAIRPMSVTAPSGWNYSITNEGAGDGYAIEFTAGSSASYVKPGTTTDFSFQSADTPQSISGNSMFSQRRPSEHRLFIRRHRSIMALRSK